MKSETNYKNINNLHSLLKFFYYATILFAIMGLITTFATPLLPDTAITFEKGVSGWFYSVNLPTGIGSSSFTIHRSIPRTILHFLPIEMINVNFAIIFDSLLSGVFLLVLVNMGLKKLINLTSDILNGETPFQLKHVKSLRNFSLMILLYSTLINTVLCILFGVFVTDDMSITFDFMWSGIFIGIIGYIFSDITEYGIFLQDEYDATL
jgi:hypothetical protein